MHRSAARVSESSSTTSGQGRARPVSSPNSPEYLVKHKRILQAGPEKTLIVYGTSFINAKPANDSPTTVFSNMWRRLRLYDYDFRKGIEPVLISRPWDTYILEKARATVSCKG